MGDRWAAPEFASHPPARHQGHVTLVNVMAGVLSTLRSVRSAVATAARQVPRIRIVIAGVAAVILVAVAVWVPLPTAVQLRDWATSVGPWFPLAFLATHIVVTIFPFPRTAFTLAAGLLFGPALGVGIAVLASAVMLLNATKVPTVISCAITMRAPNHRKNALLSSPMACSALS